MIYLKMSADQEAYLPRIDTTIAAKQELTAWMLGFYGGYNALRTDKFVLDAVAGMRYLSLGLDVSLAVNNRQVGISPSIDFYDAVIGIKGAYSINENWYIPYLFDVVSTCTTVVANGISYRRCNNSYYQPFYEGDTLVYKVVASPY